MFKKGIIMSLSPSYAVVMEKGGTFHHIKLKEDMTIGQAILYIDEDIISHLSSLIHQFRPLMALAAALILVLIPTIYAVQIPYAVVSIDINPSIELLINKQGIVKKVIAQNDDGAQLQLNQLKGYSLDNALSLLSEELTNNNFMDTSSFVLVSYADLKNNTLDLSKLLQSYMEESFKDSHIVYLSSNKESYNLSTKEHISLGRYSAGQLLNEQFPEVNFKTIDVPSLIHYLEPDDDLDDLDDFLEDISSGDLDNEANDLDDDDDDTLSSHHQISPPKINTDSNNTKPSIDNTPNNNTPPPSNNDLDDSVEDMDDDDDDDDDDADESDIDSDADKDMIDDDNDHDDESDESDTDSDDYDFDFDFDDDSKSDTDIDSDNSDD